MGNSSDVVSLAEALIACESVTPARGAVFDAFEAMLAPLGFEVHRFVAGGTVENCLAIRRGPAGSRHLAFAGHLDVVPAGEGWSSPPFVPERRAGMLYGRGAVDMKSSIAAMVAAVAEVPPGAGTISFIVTGDEEGEAIHGTRALIELIRERGEIPDMCLVGEPTSVARLGDTVKPGRRGSVNVFLEVAGREGHVAYPHLADNPVPRLVALLAELDALVLDEGSDWFQASNLEITDIAVGNPAHNVIPPVARARISIRFNDLHSGAELGERVAAIAARHGATARPVVSGESYLTPPGPLSDIVVAAIAAETGVAAELSTSGGTSDARFLKDIAPVIDFGPVNATMHKRDEAISVADLETLVGIYRRVALAALQGG